MYEREQDAQEIRRRDQSISNIADELIKLIVQCQDIATFTHDVTLLLFGVEADTISSAFKLDNCSVYRKAVETGNIELINMVWLAMGNGQTRGYVLRASDAFGIAVRNRNHRLAVMLWETAKIYEPRARQWLSELQQQKPKTRSEQEELEKNLWFGGLSANMRQCMMAINYVDAFCLATEHKNYKFMKELLALAEDEWDRWKMLDGSGIEAGKSSNCSFDKACAIVNILKDCHELRNSVMAPRQLTFAGASTPLPPPSSGSGLRYVDAFCFATEHKNYKLMKELLALAENNWDRWKMLDGAGIEAGKRSECSLDKSYAIVDKLKAYHEQQNSVMAPPQLTFAGASIPLHPPSSASSSQPTGVVAGARVTPENSLSSSAMASGTKTGASTGRTSSPRLKRGRDDEQTEWRAKLSKTGTGSQQEEGATVIR